jgi:methionyl aminopeptidase
LTILCGPQLPLQETYWKDKWTALTTDGSYSAQFEHTILITKEGHEILTLP